MGVSPRKILAIGLSLAGVVYLVAPSQGQAPAKNDPRVQAANGTANGNRPPGTPAAPTPTVLGSIDLDFVFKNYDKVKHATKELGTQFQIRKGELMKLDNEARQEVEMLQKLQPGTDGYRKSENKITELKAKMEAGREQAEREMTLRQAETMATLYKEISAYAQWVAKQRRITHVMTVSTTPPSGSDPNSVLAAVNRPLIYADPTNDITKDVVYWLNKRYHELASPSAETKPAAARQPQGSGTGGAAPAGDQ
jgi:Skp family chaperone for outer membrane proteins